MIRQGHSANARSAGFAGMAMPGGDLAIFGQTRASRIRDRGSLARDRVRCAVRRLRRSTVFTDAHRIVGRKKASQIASASRAAFFARFTYPLTQDGGVIRMSWPAAITSLPKDAPCHGVTFPRVKR